MSTIHLICSIFLMVTMSQTRSEKICGSKLIDALRYICQSQQPSNQRLREGPVRRYPIRLHNSGHELGLHQTCCQHDCTFQQLQRYCSILSGHRHFRGKSIYRSPDISLHNVLPAPNFRNRHFIQELSPVRSSSLRLGSSNQRQMRSQKICGSMLVNILRFICGNQQRPDRPRQRAQWYRLIHEHARSEMQRRCCHQGCSFQQLESYCVSERGPSMGRNSHGHRGMKLLNTFPGTLSHRYRPFNPRFPSTLIPRLNAPSKRRQDRVQQNSPFNTTTTPSSVATNTINQRRTVIVVKG